MEFILFGLTLAGVAFFHHHTLKIAVAGLAAILLYKLFFTDFGLTEHLYHEWELLVNLFGLLIGFAILAWHFEQSAFPKKLPDYLPNDWKGGFILLIFIFIISSFLDNIAAAMIGGTVAASVYRGKVHIGFLAAIVAASNAGGSGSVVGDTTTTMMWIDGVNPFDMLHAYIAAGAALLIFGFFAARQQQKYNPITADATPGIKIDGGRILIVILILVGAILTNVYLDFPAVGVWIAILVGALFRRTSWKHAIEALPGSIFLLCLVLAASMMPVQALPRASWPTAFSLGFISAVFDNIPLTRLALAQGGFDWGVLAFAVGFGGSMLWFGSSAGVALTNMFPEGRSVVAWVKNGWHIMLAYVIGFFFMLIIAGWHPHAPHKKVPQEERGQRDSTSTAILRDAEAHR